MRRLFLALWFGQLCLLGACSIDCGFSDDGTDWLQSCGVWNGCTSGLTCVCGVCTLACEDNAVCQRAGDQETECVPPESVSCRSGGSERVCLATCKAQWECGHHGGQCENGYCGSFDDWEPPYEPAIDAATRDAASDPNAVETANDANIADSALDASDDDADVASDDDAG